MEKKKVLRIALSGVLIYAVTVQILNSFLRLILGLAIRLEIESELIVTLLYSASGLLALFILNELYERLLAHREGNQKILRYLVLALAVMYAGNIGLDRVVNAQIDDLISNTLLIDLYAYAAAFPTFFHFLSLLFFLYKLIKKNTVANNV